MTTAASTVTVELDAEEARRAVRQAYRRYDFERDCKNHDICRVLTKIAEAVDE